MAKKRKVHRKKNKRKSPFRTGLLIIIFAVLVAGGLYFYLNYDSIKLNHDVNKINNVMKIGELRTKEYNYQELLFMEDVAKILGIEISNAKLAVTFTGIIKAGYKFEDINVSIADTNKIIVNLSEPQILENFIDPNSKEVVIDENGIIARIDDNKFIEEMNNIKINTEKNVRDNLLKQAKINGEILITNMIKKINRNIDNIEFVYN